MLFKFKNKKIVVDLFTDDQHAYDMFKPKPSREFIPDWWKKMPASRPDKHPQTHVDGLEIASMKTCPAIIGFMKEGFIIPSWASIEVQRHIDGKVAWDVLPTKYMSSHTHGVEDYADHKPGMHHMKFYMPWRIVEKTGVKWLWLQPSWQQRNPLSHWQSPGTINFKFTHVAEFNFFMPPGGRLSIKPGEPVTQLIPMSESPIELKYHLVTTEEWERLGMYKGWRINNFKERIKRWRQERE